MLRRTMHLGVPLVMLVVVLLLMPISQMREQPAVGFQVRVPPHTCSPELEVGRTIAVWIEKDGEVNINRDSISREKLQEVL